MWRLFASCVIAFHVAVAFGAPAIVDVGSRKQLFIDNLFLESSSQVALHIHPPVKTGERTLESDRPWENATLNWFSVAQDAGRYRMWYECYDVEGWPTPDDTSFCYAESDDAIHWRKPALGLFSYHGSPENNILFRQIGAEGSRSRVHGTGVFIDPQAAPEARYKAVSQGQFVGSTPPYRIAGMQSADGLRWTRLPRPICDIFADSQYSGFWDTEEKVYVIYGRVSGKGRALGRASSATFDRFEPLTLTLENDDADGANTDLYNPAVVRYPGADKAYFMFPSVYRHASDTLDIHVAVSRDGVHWSWPERGHPFIALGAGADFDSGSLYMGQGMLVVGSEICQYYSGSPLKHNEAELDALAKDRNKRVFSRVVSRLDGFVSVDASSQEGRFVTPLLRFQGSELRFNARTAAAGYVRIGVLDETGNDYPGLGVADSIGFAGDAVSAPARWANAKNLQALQGKTVKLAFVMKNASVFAFQFGESAPAE